MKESERRFRGYAKLIGLSGKEKLVGRRLLGGESIEELSESLGVPVGTLKTYARRSYRKAGVESRRAFCAEVFRRIAGEL